jgi:hypothetical protein
MIRYSSLLLACALAFPATGWSQSASVGMAAAKAPGTRLGAGEVEVRARVVEVDAARRTTTLRGVKGNIMTVQIPPEVKNFEQIRTGDDLVIRYATAVVATIEPASKSGIRERVESVGSANAPAGGMPGTAAVHRVEVLATVQTLDRKARTATLRGATRTVKMVVPDGIDLSKVKVGDMVHATFVEAAVLSFEHVTPKKK